MAEPELATKSPENDTVEAQPSEHSTESPFPGDTPAQTGASLGEHCTTDRPTPSGEGPSGELTQVGGVECYVSKPSDYPHAPSKVLLFLTAATGLHSVNNQIQADKFASEGFVVVLPDMFLNDPLPGTATYQEDKDPSFIERIKMGIADTAKSFGIDMWLARQTPAKVLPIIHKVIEGIKDEFADAVANGEGMYSVGYCFGGRMTLLLARESPSSGTAVPAAKDEEACVAKDGPYIKAGAIAHATLVTKEDFEGTKAPLAFICVENDNLFLEDIKEYGESYLKETYVESEFKTYTGVPHGFAVIGEYEDTSIKQAQSEAFNQMLNWLKSH